MGGLNLVTTYGYDELGNRIAQTDAANRATKYAYDPLGRRSQRTLPLGQSESYAYDANGNLSSKTDFNGHTTTYAYDSTNRLLSKTPDASFNAAAVTFTYTATGKRQTMTDPSGVTTYTYDPQDRPADRQADALRHHRLHLRRGGQRDRHRVVERQRRVDGLSVRQTEPALDRDRRGPIAHQLRLRRRWETLQAILTRTA